MTGGIIIVSFLILQSLVVSSSQTAAPDFNFFYWVNYWPGAICDSQKGCCPPPTKGNKSPDFMIHGLWPQFINGTWPAFCDQTNLFDISKISDLVSKMERKWTEWGVWVCPSNETNLWEHEWNKHGTCVQSVFDQHSYFHTNLKFRQKINFLSILKQKGIKPNDGFYGLNEIKNAIKCAIGFAPGIECNEDVEGNKQLFQIYICLDNYTKEFVECPYVPDKSCTSTIKFPKSPEKDSLGEHLSVMASVSTT
ncbi:PREDICTED: ribonuclease 3-like isoform X2 [Camelina sativa]|uniref:Ribonuclease 3-like isoform X1 n=1 Tax=Camelina sativa TaxID=90675 RepID=A0ABM0WUR0_CAMSA|nr:PREDICTED: ribonuclease 3-like isoform X1 [Camelina sativa]XP_010476461.1 PREDICTED: ribonuclease 3-like isoform X2 [Camelina sativa]